MGTMKTIIMVNAVGIAVMEKKEAVVGTVYAVVIGILTTTTAVSKCILLTINECPEDALKTRDPNKNSQE